MNVEEGLRVDSPRSQMDLWRKLQAILAAWREAERRFAEAEPGSAEQARAAGEVAQLREQYQRVYSIDHPESGER